MVPDFFPGISSIEKLSQVYLSSNPYLASHGSLSGYVRRWDWFDIELGSTGQKLMGKVSHNGYYLETELVATGF